MSRTVDRDLATRVFKLIKGHKSPHGKIPSQLGVISVGYVTMQRVYA